MDTRARTALSAGVVLALALALVWWSSSDAPTRERQHASQPTGVAERPDASALSAPPSDLPRPAPSTSAAHETSPPSALDVDPCASGEDDPPVERPSMSELLQLRVSELNDRMHALLSSPSSSAALREGLRAATDPNRGDDALTLLSRAPDRIDDGFDTYEAEAVVLTANALHAGDAQRAVHLSEIATRAAPGDALALVLGALAHDARGEHTISRDLLVRAFALEPEEPAVALTVATRIENGPDVRTALAAFDAYLAAEPEDRAMARRRARLMIRARALEHGVRFEQRGITIVGAPSLSAAHAHHLLDVVNAGLDRGARLLGVPRREELVVFVYPTRQDMQHVTCTQGWTSAAYDGALETDTDLLETEGADRSLTHESFHAAIHPAVPNVPTWLDEGLAQYASGEEGPSHLRSYTLMIREHTWIPFASMNDAFLVIDDTADAGLAYHQALAMVQWLVERRGERGIRDAAHWLIEGGDPTRVLAEAAHGELDGEMLLAFVERHVAALAAEGHAAPR